MISVNVDYEKVALLAVVIGAVMEAVKAATARAWPSYKSNLWVPMILTFMPMVMGFMISDGLGMDSLVGVFAGVLSANGYSAVSDFKKRMS